MMEDQVREAILSELQRQAEANPSKLRISTDEVQVTANGEIDLDALATAIIGAVAGGP
ncbi:hypothetical protein [Phyllobacterium salinisoli]|uniref:hypothetical protein n=1 Tax=Phyllobacterium salinisoli TaxID=1899321 RepID=UPI001357EC8F|nr:hypothetical protein [Phyllobacterium salinisoli]